MEDIQEQAKFHNYIADVLMKMKRFKEAESHIQQAAKLIRDVESNELRMDLYEVSSKYYFGTGQYEKGNDYLLRFHGLKDSLYSAGLSENVAAMEVKHNLQQLRLEKAETEAANLKLSNDTLAATQQRNLILILCACILVGGALFLYFYNERKKHLEEKQRLNAVLESEERERTRIARELHDGLGQLLSTARLNAAALEGSVEPEDEAILKTTLQLIDQSVSEVRSISHNLMPRALSDKGLPEALEELVHQVNTGKALRIGFEQKGSKGTLGKAVEIALYRVIQEALHNMIRHSGATAIRLELDRQPSQLLIRISDNGKGFDKKVAETSEGMGWSNMAARLSFIHGKFDLDSAPGKGTAITIEVKL
jgi:signal transduction histidine kinase